MPWARFGGPKAFQANAPGYARSEVKRLLVLGGIAALLVLAGATHSARQPAALLTYSVQPAGGLCLARLDGSRRVRLTRGKDSSPSWSPSGRQVAFARLVGPGQSQVVIADARGRIVRRFAAALATDPAWAPDGRRIAYAAGTRIVVATATGRTLAEISRPALVGGPAWSPNSRSLAFTEELDTDQIAVRQISVANADGTGRRALIGQASDPAWSPDGSMIAYVAYPSRLAETGHVAVAKADGTGPRRLTPSGEAESSPAWSPRGRTIAFVRGSSIVTTRTDGSGERVAIRSRTYRASDPAWRPPRALPKARRAACS